MSLTIALVLSLVGTVLTTGVLYCLRPKDIYRITWRQWWKVVRETHLLTFEKDGWNLVLLVDATDQDIEEHTYHLQQGGKAEIESNMANMSNRDTEQYQQTTAQADEVINRQLALWEGLPLPGEDDGSEAAYSQLQRDYGRFPRADGEWRRTLFMHAVPRPGEEVPSDQE